MIGHGEKLTRLQERAITGLLVSPSLMEAAQQCGVAESTLRRWMHLDGFKAAYLDARREVVQHAIVLLQAACTEAVETLQTIMRDTVALASARVAAARIILEMSIKAVETEDILQRIGALEKQAMEKRK